MLSHTVAGWILLLLGLYLGIGLLFAIAFVTKGVQRIDAGAKDSGWGFRLLILPGSVALWPWLLRRWQQGTPPPMEQTPHKQAA